MCLEAPSHTAVKHGGQLDEAESEFVDQSDFTF